MRGRDRRDAAHRVVPAVFQRATYTENHALRQLRDGIDGFRDTIPDDAIAMREAGTLLDMQGLADLLASWSAFARAHLVDPHARWTNFLTYEENLQLFASVDKTEISYLVFNGLRRRPTSTAPVLKVALYHGDIASAPNVDAYAVTMTPRVLPVGASASLDTHMDHALSRAAATPLRPVTVVTTDSTQLAGSQVLIARLDLPQAGEQLTARHVADMVAEIARTANDLGIGAIACSPFATTLGVDVGNAARAMVETHRAAAGGSLQSLVLCELDRGRYEQMRSAIDGYVELPPGPVIPTVRSDTLVLHIDVDAPVDQRPGRVRGSLLSSDGIAAVVPRHDGPLPEQVWRDLRTRRPSFTESLALGRQLWTTLLSSEQQRMLSTYRERKLLIVTNDVGAGLPWEFLADAAGEPLGGRRGVVRSVALDGAVASRLPIRVRARSCACCSSQIHSVICPRPSSRRPRSKTLCAGVPMSSSRSSSATTRRWTG